MGEDGLGRAAAAHQGALLRRGVAVVAGHEQAVAERDVAAQGLAAGRAGSARGTSAVCRWTHSSVGTP